MRPVEEVCSLALFGILASAVWVLVESWLTRRREERFWSNRR